MVSPRASKKTTAIIALLIVTGTGLNSPAAQGTSLVLSPTPSLALSAPQVPPPSPGLPSPTQDRFWTKKPELYRQIQEERKIVVSAATEKRNEKEELRVVAVGHVKQTLPTCQKLVTDFQKLKEIDDRFQEVKYFADRDRLFLHLAVYGYHTQMILQLTRRTAPESFDLEFESIEGGFKGMRGVIRLEDFKRHTTEISMTAYYESAKLPLPSSLMGVGLEIVASQVASHMRNYLEKWKP